MILKKIISSYDEECYCVFCEILNILPFSPFSPIPLHFIVLSQLEVALQFGATCVS